MAIRMGYEAELYTGTAGSTAATQLDIVRDVNMTIEPTTVDVSSRASIIDSNATAGIVLSMDFEMLNDDTVASVATLRAAAFAGTAVAFRSKDKASGVGIDGDFIVSVSEGQPLRDKQTLKFTCKPTSANRVPVWS
jgi:hypothetical protein